MEGGEAPEAVAGDARPESAVQDKDERGGTAHGAAVELETKNSVSAMRETFRQKLEGGAAADADSPAALTSWRRGAAALENTHKVSTALENMEDHFVESLCLGVHWRRSRLSKAFDSWVIFCEEEEQERAMIRQIVDRKSQNSENASPGTGGGSIDQRMIDKVLQRERRDTLQDSFQSPNKVSSLVQNLEAPARFHRVRLAVTQGSFADITSSLQDQGPQIPEAHATERCDTIAPLLETGDEVPMSDLAQDASPRRDDDTASADGRHDSSMQAFGLEGDAGPPEAVRHYSEYSGIDAARDGAVLNSYHFHDPLTDFHRPPPAAAPAACPQRSERPSRRQMASLAPLPKTLEVGIRCHAHDFNDDTPPLTMAPSTPKLEPTAPVVEALQRESFETRRRAGQILSAAAEKMNDLQRTVAEKESYIAQLEARAEMEHKARLEAEQTVELLKTAQPTIGRQPNTGQPPSNPPSNGQPQSARVKVHVHRHRHHLADGSVVEETVTKLPTDKSATREQYHQRSPPPQPSLEFTEPSSVIDRSNSPPVQWPDAGFCDAPGHRMDDTILAGSSRDRDAELFARMDGQHPVSNPFQAFQFQEESGMQCAECEVILDMDFLEIIGQQDVFKESLISDLAHACGNAQHQIEVTALRAGSVIANVNVKSVSPDGCSPLESVRALQEQIGQPDSLLMQGKYSCKIVSMTIKGEAAGPRRRDNSAPIMQRSLGIPCYEDNDLGYPRIFVGELMSSVPNAQAGRIRPGDLLAVVHGELAMLLLAISACKS